MFSEDRGESTSFGRGAGVGTEVEELFSFVSFLLPLKEESCCRLAASGASGRTGHRLGKTADGRALEGPSMLAMSSVCDSRRRFVGCGLYLFDIFNCTSSNC